VIYAMQGSFEVSSRDFEDRVHIEKVFQTALCHLSNCASYEYPTDLNLLEA
jgi:hypothetical protein